MARTKRSAFTPINKSVSQSSSDDPPQTDSRNLPSIPFPPGSRRSTREVPNNDNQGEAANANANAISNDNDNDPAAEGNETSQNAVADEEDEDVESMEAKANALQDQLERLNTRRAEKRAISATTPSANNDQSHSVKGKGKGKTTNKLLPPPGRKSRPDAREPTSDNEDEDGDDVGKKQQPKPSRNDKGGGSKARQASKSSLNAQQRAGVATGAGSVLQRDDIQPEVDEREAIRTAVREASSVKTARELMRRATDELERVRSATPRRDSNGHALRRAEAGRTLKQAEDRVVELTNAWNRQRAGPEDFAAQEALENPPTGSAPREDAQEEAAAAHEQSVSNPPNDEVQSEQHTSESDPDEQEPAPAQPSHRPAKETAAAPRKKGQATKPKKKKAFRLTMPKKARKAPSLPAHEGNYKFDKERHYKIRGIMGETKTKYKIKWARTDPEGGEWLDTWVPRGYANKSAVRDWEKRTAEGRQGEFNDGVGEYDTSGGESDGDGSA